MSTNYNWKSPIANGGDLVTYTDHRGRKRAAECMEVTTRYDENRDAWHTYTLRPDDHSALVQVTEDRLVSVNTVRLKARRARG